MTKLGTSLRTTYDGAQLVQYRPVNTGLAATDVQKAIDLMFTMVIAAGVSPPNITRVPVNFAASPYAPAATVFFIEVDVTAGPVVINLPLAATRNNLPIIIKHVAGNAAVNNITINSSGGETFDNLASPYVIDFNGGGVNLQPKTGGWELVP